MEPNGALAVDTIVQLEQVSKEYHLDHGVVSVLKNVTLDIPQGQFVVILGPSGSGKPTLLNIVGGIDTATSGRVWVGEHEITRLDERLPTMHRRTQIGYVVQFFNLIPTLTTASKESVE